jgi:hypothetical protein
MIPLHGLVNAIVVVATAPAAAATALEGHYDVSCCNKSSKARRQDRHADNLFVPNQFGVPFYNVISNTINSLYF